MILHVLKVNPYHVEQPVKQFWSCLNDWNLFSIVGQKICLTRGILQSIVCSGPLLFLTEYIWLCGFFVVFQQIPYSLEFLIQKSYSVDLSIFPDTISTYTPCNTLFEAYGDLADTDTNSVQACIQECTKISINLNLSESATCVGVKSRGLGMSSLVFIYTPFAPLMSLIKRH